MDKNDNTPEFSFPSSSNSTVQLSSYAPQGHVVTHVTAHDLDAGTVKVTAVTLMSQWFCLMTVTMTSRVIWPWRRRQRSCNVPCGGQRETGSEKLPTGLGERSGGCRWDTWKHRSQDFPAEHSRRRSRNSRQVWQCNDYISAGVTTTVTWNLNVIVAYFWISYTFTYLLTYLLTIPRALTIIW